MDKVQERTDILRRFFSENDVDETEIKTFFQRIASKHSITGGFADATINLVLETSTFALQSFSKDIRVPAFWALYFFPHGKLTKKSNGLYNYTLRKTEFEALLNDVSIESRLNAVCLNSAIFFIYIARAKTYLILNSKSPTTFMNKPVDMLIKSVQIDRIPTSQSIEYLAGLIEGGVGHFRVEDRNFVIASRHLVLLEKIALAFGINKISKSGRQSTPTHAITFNIYLTKQLLNMVLPYLHRRKAEAEEIINYSSP